MFEYLLAFGFMSAVTIALQAVKHRRVREEREQSVTESCPDAERIVFLFEEAERLSAAA